MLKRVLTPVGFFLTGLFIIMLFVGVSSDVKYKWVVYIVVSVMTAAHLMISYYLLILKGLRIAAAPVISGSVIFLAILIAGFLLLFFDAGLKQSIYVESLLSVLYGALMIYFAVTMEE
ncbi:MAG: hypothetical protein K6G22_11190 [Lachnospiraceae bacterium]|nr:hypothetical protein [Lachnospiraceae bacterium]